MYKVLIDGALLCDSRIDELAIINPVVNPKANSAGSFSFTITSKHPKRDLIHRKSSIISVFIDDEIEPVFQGIVVNETTDFFNQTTFECEGELSYLNDSILRQAHYSSLTARQLLEAYINSHNSQVEESKRFEIGVVTISGNVTCFTNMESTLTQIKKDLLDDFGGFLRIRYADGKKYIDYLAESPYTSNQIIELGKNLIDYESNIDSTEIATSIIPLGAKLETQTIEGLDAYTDIKSVNDGLDYIYSESAVETYGWITQVIHWDDVEVPANLLTKASQYLSDIQFENVVLKVSAVDFGLLASRFDRLHILDQVRVVSAPHGMDRYFMLTEQTLNLNEPEKDTITFGTTGRLSLTAQTNKANEEILRRIEQVPTSSFVKSAIDNATQLITGNKGGYVVTKTNADGQPIEILIQDALENPTKIWRWNQSGLGFSSDGGKTYGLAMTSNGAIVADFITSGTMRADRISGGTLQGTEIIVDKVLKLTPTDGSDPLNVIEPIVKTIRYREAIGTYPSLGYSETTDTRGKVDCAKIGGQTSTYIYNELVADHLHCTESLSTNNLVVEGPSYMDDVRVYSMWAQNQVSAVSWDTRSDRRLKQDIVNLDSEKAKRVIYGLRPTQYRFIQEGIDKELHHGFIAQEVKELLEDNWGIFHEHLIDSGTVCTLAYNELIADLVSVSQSQHQEIEGLKSRIERLETMNG